LRGIPTPATLEKGPANRCGGGRPSCVSPCTRAVSRDVTLVTTLFLLATGCSDGGAPAVLSPGVVASITVTLEAASLPVGARTMALVQQSTAGVRWACRRQSVTSATT